jgi:HEPN domain-containing protein
MSKEIEKTEKRLAYAENLIKKAKDFFEQAENIWKDTRVFQWSNLINNCQQTIELSGKAIFKLMGLDFPKNHQLLIAKPEKEEIWKYITAEKIWKETEELLSSDFPEYFDKEKIPKVIFLSYFWSQFYTLGKYGVEKLNIPPDQLFGKEEAELAIKHAKFCLDVAQSLYQFKEIEFNKVKYESNK